MTDPKRHARPTTEQPLAATEQLVAHMQSDARPTTKLGRDQLLGLLGDAVPEEAVVDVHAIEADLRDAPNKHVLPRRK